MTRETRARVNEILIEGFTSGSIELDEAFDRSKLKAYVSSLQSNWLRKDNRLNGGMKYLPKNPGSRQGSGDAQLKALRSLLAITVDKADRAEIEIHIAQRMAELAKIKQPTIDFSALPPELAAKLNK